MTKAEKTVYLGQLTEVYGCIEEFTQKKFLTTDVITTSANITHMNEAENHPNSYAKYGHLLADCFRCPDWIGAAKRGCYHVAKKFLFDDGKEEYLKIILQLKSETDPADYLNKVTTCFRMGQKNFGKLMRSKQVLYRREGV